MTTATAYFDVQIINALFGMDVEPELHFEMPDEEQDEDLWAAQLGLEIGINILKQAGDDEGPMQRFKFNGMDHVGLSIYWLQTDDEDKYSLFNGLPVCTLIVK